MKKIKEYINIHPKLKKTIKFFTILIFILSIGFNFLIICVASCSNTHDDYDVTQYEVIATTPLVSKNMIEYKNSQDNDIFIFSQSDLSTSDTLLGILDYINQLEGGSFDPYSTSHSRIEYNLSTKSYLVLPWSTMATYYNNNRFYTEPFSSIGNSTDYGDMITIIWNYVSYMQSWNVNLRFNYNYNGSGYASYVTYSFDYKNGLNSTPYVSVSSSNYSIAIIDSDNPLYFIGRYDSRKGTYYDEGYNNGYNVGYNQGFNDGNTATTSPFTLISNAFSSIASILNIQILPNLSLGVLIFAPLVIVIIIAIFKIFRG